ncbi:hypothetical protein OEZ85_012856 [Tetradesmus obliquus]|uniref:Uncharacterized protein n=1 Tax=Tetradesmus obliquus TaxID=3088 RepID=A0ABY8U439_TETOB|nr:hypothetical protein OEZ85_012856 [Tetradesmus obliquus]
MGRWQQQFDALQIRHLRSSSAVHPDPLDTYALATYASSQGRLNETQALNHIHKNQDFHGPFHTPGSALFEDFCKDAIHRYCLDDIITQDKVVTLTPAFAGSSSSSSSSSVPGKLLTAVDHWLVGLASGQQLQAKKVIVGIGSTNKMRIPPPLAHLQPTAVHSSSSSSSDEAAKEPQVSLLMRGPWRVKQFDVDVPFMGRLRGKRLAEFGRMHSFSQRLALIKSVLQVSLMVGWKGMRVCIAIA